VRTHGRLKKKRGKVEPLFGTSQAMFGGEFGWSERREEKKKKERG